MAAEAAHLNSKDVPTSLYQYEEIGNVHLELTHRCNAACPMCARNLSGGITNPNLPLVELSLSDIERIFTPSFINNRIIIHQVIYDYLLVISQIP